MGSSSRAPPCQPDLLGDRLERGRGDAVAEEDAAGGFDDLLARALAATLAARDPRRDLGGLRSLRRGLEADFGAFVETSRTPCTAIRKFVHRRKIHHRPILSTNGQFSCYVSFMKTLIHEITMASTASRLRSRRSARGFTFNQFLIKADQPLLFHTAPDACSRRVAGDRARHSTVEPPLDRVRPRRV